MTHTENSVNLTLQAGMAASAKGDVEAALQLYQQACHENPNLAAPHFLCAAELAQARRYNEAEAAYAMATLLDPELHIARFELGTLQFTSGRPAMALLSWEPLMLLPDSHALKLLVHGYAALAQDQFDAALAWFAQGMAANSDNLALNKNIGLLVAAIERAGKTTTPESTAQFFLSGYERSSGSLH